MYYDKLKGFYLFQGIEEKSIEKINQMSIIEKEYSSGELVNVMGEKNKLHTCDLKRFTEDK